MTNEPKGRDFGEPALRRANKPLGEKTCSDSCHGPRHEIVKKPFATPLRRPRGLRWAARRKDVNCLEIPLARLDGRSARQISRHRISQLSPYISIAPGLRKRRLGYSPKNSRRKVPGSAAFR